MSTTDRALERLAQLSASDRTWVVQRLSAAAKSRLRAASDGEPKRAPATGTSPVPAEAPIEADVIERLAAARADRIIATLRSEPRWLICAVLRTHEWPWTRQFMQALSPSTRVEVSRLEHQGISLSRPALDAVLRQLAERVGAPRVVGRTRSRFELVLSRWRGTRSA
jgi:hypothetical protein